MEQDPGSIMQGPDLRVPLGTLAREKQGWWSPPSGYREEEWRALNKAADGAATKAQEKQWTKQKLYRQHLQATKMGAQVALQRLWRGAETFRRNYPEKHNEGKGNYKKGKDTTERGTTQDREVQTPADQVIEIESSAEGSSDSDIAVIQIGEHEQGHQ